MQEFSSANERAWLSQEHRNCFVTLVQAFCLCFLSSFKNCPKRPRTILVTVVSVLGSKEAPQRATQFEKVIYLQFYCGTQPCASLYIDKKTKTCSMTEKLNNKRRAPFVDIKNRPVLRITFSAGFSSLYLRYFSCFPSKNTSNRSKTFRLNITKGLTLSSYSLLYFCSTSSSPRPVSMSCVVCFCY